jgi:hypothetical protein
MVIPPRYTVSKVVDIKKNGYEQAIENDNDVNMDV